MPVFRDIILAISPQRLSEAMERESRQWIMTCPKGHEQSVWEAGGIRFAAAGNPTRRAWCGKCKCATWQTLSKRQGSLSDPNERPDEQPGSAKPPLDSAPHGKPVPLSPLTTVALVFIMIGAMFLWGSVAFVVPSLIFVLRADRTAGVVESLQAEGRGTVPRVRYEVAGKSYTAVGRTATSPPSSQAGQRVEVLYHPHQPEVARLDTFTDRWLLQAIFGAIGAVSATLGALCMLWVKLRSPRQTADRNDVDFPR